MRDVIDLLLIWDRENPVVGTVIIIIIIVA